MKQKTIFVAICGKPNVGKSTILNKFLQEKLSIVSYKPQTTRNSIRGVLTKGDVQVVFVDTPGILNKPKSKLQDVIVKNAWNGMSEGIDLACFVIDGENGLTHSTLELAKSVRAKIPNMICVINKVDRIKQEEFKFKTALKIAETGLFDEIFGMSATKQQGIDEVLEYIMSKAKEDRWFYEEDDLTDRPNALIASDVTRETIFNKIKDEIPYGVDVITNIFTFHEGYIEIAQDILISRKAYKPIILGSHGSMIKAIRVSTTKKLEDFYETKVNLELFVKVKEDWLEKVKVD
ncbi:GTPase Era [Candidatus Deianiraea vastatrix]|nr:GTPase Era [Candidatus Deianiraea vastatrix]